MLIENQFSRQQKTQADKYSTKYVKCNVQEYSPSKITDSFFFYFSPQTGEHTSVIYGTHYPYRLFVGCLPPDAGAEDLGTFFSEYGNVVEAKVVLDDKGCSKRFGFVTFSNKDNVADLIKSRAIKFKGKMINVGPAVKKNVSSIYYKF